MARADLLVSLVKSYSHGDLALFQKTVEAIIAEERSNQHHLLADRLVASLKSNGQPPVRNSEIIGDRINNLFFEVTPHRNIADLILPDQVITACQELIEEQHRADLLRSYNLEPRHRVLLVGPPGNGKTSLAEAIATSLMIPLFIVRYEGVIGTYLGETAVRLKNLFEYVRTRQCVLFFDEFDTLGKERGDVHETGEIKRVVSSLLLQVDALPSYVVVITATNHPELLDRAVWRRFQLRLLLPPPTSSQLEEWFHRFEMKTQLSLGYSHHTLAEKLSDISFAEAENFTTDIQRRYVLSSPNANIKQIVTNNLKQWQVRFNAAKVSKNKSQ